MEKKRKPLSTKKPPIPQADHGIIADWMQNSIMPGVRPLIEKTDANIRELIPDLHYAVKWGSAYYGSQEHGWLIEVAAYSVSFNIVFLNGAELDPQTPVDRFGHRFGRLWRGSFARQHQTGRHPQGGAGLDARRRRENAVRREKTGLEPGAIALWQLFQRLFCGG